jgi:hypothetical protein
VPLVADTLNIVIIGGSQTAKQLILDFESRPFVRVVGVADIDPASAAAEFAQQAGLRFTTDIHEFANLDPSPDIVVDVCGRPHVNPALTETFAPPEEGGPVIVHDLIARLLVSIAADSLELAPSCSVLSEATKVAGR